MSVRTLRLPDPCNGSGSTSWIDEAWWCPTSFLPRQIHKVQRKSSCVFHALYPKSIMMRAPSLTASSQVPVSDVNRSILTTWIGNSFAKRTFIQLSLRLTEVANTFDVWCSFRVARHQCESLHDSHRRGSYSIPTWAITIVDHR